MNGSAFLHLRSGAPPDRTDPWKRLAMAVLLMAWQDARRGRHGARAARRWLTEWSPALEFWCRWAGWPTREVNARFRAWFRRADQGLELKPETRVCRMAKGYGTRAVDRKRKAS